MIEFWKFLRILLAVLFVVNALFSTWFWVTHRFWVPRYVHGLAVGATLGGFWMRWILPADAPIRSWGWSGDVVSVLLFPTLVYATFVFYGGPAQAWIARERKRATLKDDSEA
jgi:hypothetical protein